LSRLPHTALWVDAANAAKLRLREPLWWFPFPIFLSFALVLLLTAHVLFGTSPRMGHPANIITFPSESRRDSAIWLSVTPIGKEVVVTTGDRRVFRWPLEVHSLEELKPFRAYLKEEVARELAATALTNTAFEHQTTVVIAADQRLKYLHVRPLLHAFAEAGISHYAFETQNPTLAARESGDEGVGVGPTGHQGTDEPEMH
jgi:hypothetical protein